MMHYHDFQVTLNEYHLRERENSFPDLDYCPICHAKNRLNRHGFYERNAINEHHTYRIPICRLICPDCKKTVSILPTFLLPYFQHTIYCILNFLLAFWVSGKTLYTRQLRRFYEKRAYAGTTNIELFFREHGVLAPFPKAKEKTIKLFQMILDLSESTFVRRWWSHRVTSFMAHSLYHGARVVKTV